MKSHHLSALFSILLFLIISQPVKAQGNTTYPIYIVQPGETLSIIAQKFGVTVDDIVKINAITNPNIISVGMHLSIPGLEGISGVLTTTPVGIGQTLDSFIHSYQVSRDFLLQVNHVTSPAEIYAGSNLIIPVNDAKPQIESGDLLQPGQSVLELAIIKQLNPWSLLQWNEVNTSTELLPGEFLTYQTNQANLVTSQISPLLKSVAITPLPLVQGNTEILIVDSFQPITLSGSLNGYELHFFKMSNGKYYALQGIHAMADPGLVDFTLKGNFDSGQDFSFEQMLLLQSGYYAKDPPLQVSDEMIDPAITKPEDDLVISITSKFTSQKYWTEQFANPVDPPFCYKSVFGTRRSFNGSDYIYFHSGLDFGVCAPSHNIYAAGPGKVVFAGPLTVRGNATFIDHGEGVFTGYFHQSEIKVKVGDMVTQGQLIGVIGATGRVTGPHLHFEVWVNGVQVNPLTWLNNTIP